MTHIEKADIKLVSSEAGEIFDEEIYSRLAWLASRHAENTCSGAELLEKPLTELEAFQMMDQFGLVAGYFLVDIEDVGEGDFDVAAKLAPDVEINDLRFEVVWGHSKTLMLYACGKASGG